MSAATDALREAGFVSAVLWVHPDNDRACSFYRRRGWSDDGVERARDVRGAEVPEARLSRALVDRESAPS